MKLKKDWNLIQTTVNERTGKAFCGLAGHDGYIFRNIPSDLRIYMVDEGRNEIYIADKATFNRIKDEKLLHENLFPYDKSFKDLEEFQSGSN